MGLELLVFGCSTFTVPLLVFELWGGSYFNLGKQRRSEPVSVFGGRQWLFRKKPKLKCISGKAAGIHIFTRTQVSMQAWYACPNSHINGLYGLDRVPMRHLSRHVFCVSWAFNPCCPSCDLSLALGKLVQGPTEFYFMNPLLAMHPKY